MISVTFIFLGPNSTVGYAAQTQHWIFMAGTVSKILTPPELDFIFYFFKSVSQKSLNSLQICSLENVIKLQRDRLMGTIALTGWRQNRGKAICAFTSRKPNAYQCGSVHTLLAAWESPEVTRCLLTLLLFKDRISPGLIANVQKQTAQRLHVTGRAVALEC